MTDGVLVLFKKFVERKICNDSFIKGNAFYNNISKGYLFVGNVFFFPFDLHRKLDTEDEEVSVSHPKRGIRFVRSVWIGQVPFVVDVDVVVVKAVFGLDKFHSIRCCCL
jgi:hypothetical protein